MNIHSGMSACKTFDGNFIILFLYKWVKQKDKNGQKNMITYKYNMKIYNNKKTNNNYNNNNTTDTTGSRPSVPLSNIPSKHVRFNTHHDIPTTRNNVNTESNNNPTLLQLKHQPKSLDSLPLIIVEFYGRL